MRGSMPCPMPKTGMKTKDSSFMYTPNTVMATSEKGLMIVLKIMPTIPMTVMVTMEGKPTR